MINFHEELATALETILPTHYEMTLTSKTPKPCISYMELTNGQEQIGDTIGYSRITYQIKVWADRIKLAQEYANQVDELVRTFGAKRISANELYDNQSSTVQKILTYEILVLEEF